MDDIDEPLDQTRAEWALQEIKRRRTVAYADPVTGSDRLFVEAQRMQVMGLDGWEGVRDQAVTRYLEIQVAHPYPVQDALGT